MKKALKVAVVLFIIAAVVLAGLTFFARSYLTDERIRAYLVVTAEKSLGRKVGLGAIQVSIFKGISVKDFEIKEKDSNEPFVKAEEFVLNYQLLPLLSKSLVIDELKLVNARLRVHKNADGTFNFSDIGRPPDKEEAKGRPPGVQGLPVALNVRSFSLKNTVIEYAEPAGTLLKAQILIDADLGITSPSAGMISSAGNFRLTAVEAALRDKHRPLKDLTAQGTYRIALNMSLKKIDIAEIKADVAKVPLMMKGYVSYADPLSFSLEMKIQETQLSTLQKAGEPFLPEGTSLDGAASFAVSAEKSATTGSGMTFTGQLNLNRVAVAAKGYRPVFDGTIRFTPDRISLDGVKLVAGENSADITGQIKNYSKEPDLQIRITAKTLNLDALTASGQKVGSDKAASPSLKREEKEFEPISRKIHAAGSVDVDSLILKGVAIQNLRTVYELRDNTFRISSMTGNTLSGNFRLQSSVDLSKRGTAYTLSADTNGIRLEDITAAFAPKARDTLYGGLYGKMDFSGAGTLRESIKQNLKGKGNFSVKDGKIKNAQISSGLLRFLGLQDLREIPMDRADGSFTIADGTMNLTSMITNRDLIIDEKGTIGMDERLDLGVLVKASEKLSPKMLSQSSSSQFLSEEKGWTVIPLKVGGTITNPSYGVDMHYVGKRLQKKAEEEVFRALSGDKEKKDKASPQDKKKSISPEDLLKGFFK